MPDWIRASWSSLRSARRWLETLIAGWLGKICARTGIMGGRMMVANKKLVQITASCGAMIQPANMAKTRDGADSVRLRLSSIFQRPMAGTLPLVPLGPSPKTQGNSCQSPRSQRW